MRIEYKLQDKIDLAIVLPVFTLIVVGIIAIFSSTLNHPTASDNPQKQMMWAVVSVFLFFFVYFLPNRTFRVFAIPVYLLSLTSLVAVLFVGKMVYGAQSWVSLGPVGFQPSEFGKIGLILALGYWLSYQKRDINNVKDIGIALLIGLIPVFLILLEPDMGTALVYLSITIVMLFWSGLNLFGVFVVLSPLLVAFSSLFGVFAVVMTMSLILVALYYFKQNLFISSSVFIVNLASAFIFDFAYKLLQPHQQKRIESFINPAADPLGSGYNAMQAKVAIGSGGLIGKGFLQGNQTQLRFIPEQWTDFIYCVVGEEFGFIGSMIVISLFLIVFLRLINLSYIAKDSFGSIVTIGILSMYLVHFVINIGMNIGIAPVIGLPLPFVSYGGSSLVVNMLLLGVALNIYRNRKEKA